MSDCTTCGDSGEQAVGYSGGETIDDPTCYPTGCPPCSEAITFPENPVMGNVSVSLLVKILTLVKINLSAGCMITASPAGALKVPLHLLLPLRVV